MWYVELLQIIAKEHFETEKEQDKAARFMSLLFNEYRSFCYGEDPPIDFLYGFIIDFYNLKRLNDAYNAKIDARSITASPGKIICEEELSPDTQEVSSEDETSSIDSNLSSSGSESLWEGEDSNVTNEKILINIPFDFTQFVINTIGLLVLHSKAVEDDYDIKCQDFMFLYSDNFLLSMSKIVLGEDTEMTSGIAPHDVKIYEFLMFNQLNYQIKLDLSVLQTEFQKVIDQLIAKNKVNPFFLYFYLSMHLFRYLCQDEEFDNYCHTIYAKCGHYAYPVKWPIREDKPIKEDPDETIYRSSDRQFTASTVSKSDTKEQGMIIIPVGSTLNNTQQVQLVGTYLQLYVKEYEQQQKAGRGHRFFSDYLYGHPYQVAQIIVDIENGDVQEVQQILDRLYQIENMANKDKLNPIIASLERTLFSQGTIESSCKDRRNRFYLLE